MSAPRPMRRAACLLLAAPALLGSVVLGSACASDPSEGYAFASSYSSEVRTVAVPIFENTTFITGVEIELTDAIVKEIQRSTPWRVASSRAADTELIGTITRAEGRPLTFRSGTGLPEEQTYELRVDFVFRDATTGEALVTKQQFSAVSTFVPERSVGERVEVGQRQAVQELARAIVGELRSDW